MEIAHTDIPPVRVNCVPGGSKITHTGYSPTHNKGHGELQSQFYEKIDGNHRKVGISCDKRSHELNCLDSVKRHNQNNHENIQCDICCLNFSGKCLNMK